MVVTQTIVAVFALAIALIVDMYVNDHPVEHPHLVSVIAAAPSFLAIGLAVFDNSFGGFLMWIAHDPLPCSIALFFLAVLPTVCGLAIDVPLAFRAYARRVGASFGDVCALPSDARCAVAEYGDPLVTEFTTGRYLPTPRFVVYSLMCNITGVSCTILLVLLVYTLPEMREFVVSSDSWVNILELTLSFSIWATLAHLYQEQTKKKPPVVDLTVENPDMYRLSRLHTLMNTLFLVLHVALCAALAILLFFFGLTHFQGSSSFEALICLSLAVVATLLFMWFSSASPLARDFDAECGGLWKIGPFVLAGAYVALTLCLFAVDAISWWLVGAVVAAIVGIRLVVKPMKSGLLAAVPVVMLLLTIVGVFVVLVS